MTGWKLLQYWSLHPSVIIGCLVLLGAYLWAVRFKVTNKSIDYSLGILTIFLALCSPIDTLGDDYLFSAHMLQHVILAVVTPPLLVAGLHQSWVRAWLRSPPVAWLERILSYPPLALFIGIAVFYVWHLPALYNATLESEGVHIFEHITFLVSGVILFWPVFKPVPEGRLGSISSMLYLAAAASINAVLGVILTVAETPYYSAYAHPDDEIGALHLIRDTWGISQLSDQQLGGSIMWGFGGLIFLWAIMMIMADWYRAPDTDLEEESEQRRIESVGKQ